MAIVCCTIFDPIVKITIQSCTHLMRIIQNITSLITISHREPLLYFESYDVNFHAPFGERISGYSSSSDKQYRVYTMVICAIARNTSICNKGSPAIKTAANSIDKWRFVIYWISSLYDFVFQHSPYMSCFTSVPFLINSKESSCSSCNFLNVY